MTYTSNISASIPNSEVKSCSVYFNSNQGNTVTSVSSSKCRVYGYHIENPGTSKCYIQFFDSTSQNVVLGTTTPVMSLVLPPGGGLDTYNSLAIAGFDTALSIAITSTSTGSSAPNANCLVNIFYS